MPWPRKLSDEQYREILAAYCTNETAVSIAKRYDISGCMVFRIAEKFGVPTKAHRNKRQQVIRASIDYPQLGPTAIARLVGANSKYVQRVRTQCGFTKRHHVLTGAPTPDQSSLQGIAT